MRFLSFLLLLPLFSISVSAFDTGHHYDATRNGLELRGFSRTSDSIPIVQLCNYVTDWNAIAYEVKLPNFDHYKELASLLHFSNLYNSTMVRDYWVQFLTNQRMTVEAILNDEVKQFTETGATNDTSYQRLDTNFMLLCTLGYTLHATQDFYTHSNFITTLVKPQSNNNNNNNADTCYFTANTFNFSNIASDYNLHTYYYPDKYNETIRSQWPQAAHGLTIHGGYKDGINKDSYAKENFQDAYASAFMGTIDTLDTWRGWIKDDARWAAIQNYNITSEDYGGRLIEGLLATFAVSNYIQVPFTGEDGHWKGPGSGSKKESADIVSDFIHDDWQQKSPFQRTFYDTDISSRLTFGLGKQVANTSRDQLVFIPDVASDVIANFDAQKLGIIQNDPADYKAIVLRTWGAGKWKTTPSHDDDQEVDGVYAIISIDGQEFREATQYQGWTHPFWTAMRFVPKEQRQVVISYDLMIYATDLSRVFQNDKDIEANIHPPQNASSSQAQQATADYKLHTIRSYRVHHTKLMSLAPIGDKIYYKTMSRLSSLRHQLNTRKRMSKMAAAEIVNGIYRDEINPDQMDPYKKGVIFTLDTQTQQVVEGLPDYYLKRTYLDLNHTLRLQGANDINIAQVNVTINVRSMCETTKRQQGTLGDTHAAQVAAPDGDWGERPTISGASGAYTTTTSLSVTLISYASVCAAVLLSLLITC